MKRTLGSGEQRMIRIDAQAVSEGRTPDLPMIDGDVVQVPASTGGWHPGRLVRGAASWCMSAAAFCSSDAQAKLGRRARPARYEPQDRAGSPAAVLRVLQTGAATTVRSRPRPAGLAGVLWRYRAMSGDHLRRVRRPRDPCDAAHAVPVHGRRRGSRSRIAPRSSSVFRTACVRVEDGDPAGTRR